MVSNGERREAKSEGHRRHYFAVKTLAALLRGITSKNNGNYYPWNCLQSFKKKKAKLNHRKNYVKIKIFVV